MNIERFRKLLAEEIERCEYLQFAIGNLIGDWAGVAATEARKQGRSYAIHTDRVEPQLLRKLAERKNRSQCVEEDYRSRDDGSLSPVDHQPLRGWFVARAGMLWSPTHPGARTTT